VGFACLCTGLGGVTSMSGSCVLPDSGASGLEVGISPAAGAGGAGAAAAGGGSLPRDCAVCAKAPAQSDENRKDVEASHIVRIAPDLPQI
jgi:hypothetical protein